MKRFLVWQGHHYYPSGPQEDFIGDFDSMEEAMAALSIISNRWWEVLDTKTGLWSAGP
jgi:hypothetical protein